MLRSREGRLCVRYFQRADGKVLTRDCPKGLMVARMKLARVVALTAGLVLGSFGVAIAKVSEKPDQTWVDRAIEKGRTVPGVDVVIEKLCPSMQGNAIAGAMPIPSPPPVVGRGGP